MATHSFWTVDGATNTAAGTHGGVPQAFAEADVCIVGAGIAGLTLAYLLAKEGRQVLVLDRNTLGSGETSRTSAHLASMLDYRYSELVQWHTPEDLRLVARSHADAIGAIENIAGTEGIDCSFGRVAGYLVPTPEDSSDVIKSELRDASGAGLRVSKTDSVPYLLDANRPALRVEDQAVFHPVRYLHGLANAARKAGVEIAGGANVQSIEPGKPATVVLDDGTRIRAQHVVQASNTPFAHTFTIHTKQAAYRSYVATYKLNNSDTIEDALIWDTADPFHYVRTYRDMPDGPVYLVAGGEDHKTGHPPSNGEPFRRLDAWVRQHFDVQGEAETRWSGQILEPMDGLAYIGRVDDDEHSNLYMVTGTSGNGLTYGTLAARLLADLIARRPNDLEKVYSPGRVNLRATTTFVKENVDVIAQFTDWVTPGEVATDRDILPGAGAILRDGASKQAVYRDVQGVVHKFSAVCPHMGCLVSWNHAEHTWDCPCHGSRFAPKGQILNGPTTDALKPAEK